MFRHEILTTLALLYCCCFVLSDAKVIKKKPATKGDFLPYSSAAGEEFSKITALRLKPDLMDVLEKKISAKNTATSFNRKVLEDAREKTHELYRSLLENEDLAKQIAEQIYLEIMVSVALNLTEMLPKGCCHKSAPRDCDDKPDGYYPVAACCQYFYYCSKGTDTLLTCPDNPDVAYDCSDSENDSDSVEMVVSPLYYNPKTGYCDATCLPLAPMS